MTQYAIKLTKDDHETILTLFPDRESVLKAGPVFRRNYPREQGLISCILAEFDRQGCRQAGAYRLIEVWQ